MRKIFFVIISVLFIYSQTAYAYPIDSINIISVKGENFSAKLLIDYQGEEIKVEIGTKDDYKQLNLVRPGFIDYLYVNIPYALFEQNKKIIYILSKDPEIPQKFDLVIKTTLNEKSYLEVFPINWKGMDKSYQPKLKVTKKEDYESLSFLESLFPALFVFHFEKNNQNLKFNGNKKAKTDSQIQFVRLIYNSPIIIDQLYLKIGTANKVIISLDPKVNFDGGLALLLGGGIVKNFEIQPFQINLNADFYNFSKSGNEKTSTSNSTAELKWMQYQIGSNLKYNGIKYFSPYIGIFLTKISGDFLLTEKQIVSGIITDNHKDFTDSELLGAKAGVNLLYNGFNFFLESKFLAETGFGLGLGYSF